LDEVVPDRYVGLSHVTGHAAVVNTKSLRYLGFRGNKPGVDTDRETGEPTGVVRDPAVMEVQDRLMGLKTDEELKRAVRTAAEDAARVGLTTVHTVGEPLGQRGVRIVMESADRLPVRVLIYPLVSDQIDRDLENTPGKAGLKVIADGAIETHTAALYEPYTDDPTTKGMLYYTQESMNEVVLRAHMANMQLAIHCESDTTIDQVLDAYENALKKHPSGDHRHRIEHYELSTDEQNRRVARLGIFLSMQPAFIYLWGGPDGKYAEYLGKERMKRAHTYKSLLDLAIPIAGGSDSFVTPWNPILGIHALVNHPDAEQRVSLRDALNIFTINGARIGFEEGSKGSVEVGKLADLVVLSKDPYACKPDEILGIEIMMTIVGGKIVYEKKPE
jgi:predicted amidohydrolase YtcJ